MKGESTNSNSYWLVIDDAQANCPMVIGDSSTDGYESWEWINYMQGNTGALATVTLTQGTHVVKLLSRESNTSVDRLLFIPTNVSCTPTEKGDNCLVTPTTTIAITSTVAPSQTPVPNPTDTPLPTAGPSPTPFPSSGSVIPNPPPYWDQLPENLRGFLEQLYLTIYLWHRDTNMGHLLQGIVQ